MQSERNCSTQGIRLSLSHVCAIARRCAGRDADVIPPVVDGYVPNFTEPRRVADGASELLVQVFGERGIHARSAVSVAQLPFGACIEIDMIAELRATQVGERI